MVLAAAAEVKMSLQHCSRCCNDSHQALERINGVHEPQSKPTTLLGFEE